MRLPQTAERLGTLSTHASYRITSTLSPSSHRTESIRAPLSPSGREINYEASWGFGLPGGVDAGLTATLSTQPNHVANADPASVYWFSLSKSW